MKIAVATQFGHEKLNNEQICRVSFLFFNESDVALDIYNSNHDYGVSSAAFTELAGWAGNKKLVTMSECATMPDPDLIVRDNAYWLWFAVWNWDYIVKDGTTELSDAYTSFDMMEKVYNSDIMITRDQLPEF